jgi:hypothetical protein
MEILNKNSQFSTNFKNELYDLCTNNLFIDLFNFISTNSMQNQYSFLHNLKENMSDIFFYSPVNI